MTATERSRLSTLTFVDPQHDPAYRHATITSTAPRPSTRSLRPLSAEIVGAGRSRSLPEWITETSTTSLLVLDARSRTIITEWYAPAAEASSLLLGASMGKSVLAHLVALAVGSGALSLDDPVVDHVPELAGTGWADCSVRHLLSMTSGTAWVEDHRDPAGPASRLVGCFGRDGESSRALLTEVGAAAPPGTRWEYSTADSQVLDWVRERAAGAPYAEALQQLWNRLGCVEDAVVSVDVDGVAMAGGGLAACAEDWLTLTALQLDGSDDRGPVLTADWVQRSSAPAFPFTVPGVLPSSITTHAGFGLHWWPLDTGGRRVIADGSRGQFGYVDRDAGVAVVKTSLWPYEDAWVDRQQRDLCYLGLPLVAAAARRS